MFVLCVQYLIYRVGDSRRLRLRLWLSGAHVFMLALLSFKPENYEYYKSVHLYVISIDQDEYDRLFCII